MPLAEQLIWRAMLDGRFRARVVRSGPYSGVLTIEDEHARVLLRDNVSLSYGALWGPEPLDMQEWQQRAEAFLAGMEK